MSTKIKTAIIGYGRSGQLLHGTGLRGNTDHFEVVAVTSISEGSQHQAAQDFGCPIYSNHQDMLTQHNLNLVIIVTRNDQHCQMACDALNAGSNVLVTKPLGCNAGEVDQIYHTADKNKKKIYPYLPARWGSDFLRLKEIIDSGEIGNVFAIHRSVFGFATRDDWQTQQQYGGGIVLNWGAHLVDPPLLLSGGKPKTLFGSCRQLLNPGDAEDTFYSVITTDNGVRVHSQWSFAPQGTPNWFIQGTQGCIIGNDRTLEIHTGQPSHPSDPTNEKAMEGKDASSCRTETVGEAVYGDPIEIYQAVAQDLTGNSLYPVSRDEALQLTRILDAIKESETTQQLVHL